MNFTYVLSYEKQILVKIDRFLVLFSGKTENLPGGIFPGKVHSPMPPDITGQQCVCPKISCLARHTDLISINIYNYQIGKECFYYYEF